MSFKSPNQITDEQRQSDDDRSYEHQCRNVTSRLDRDYNASRREPIQIELHSTTNPTAARIARELRASGWYVDLESSGHGHSHCLHVTPK